MTIGVKTVCDGCLWPSITSQYADAPVCPLRMFLVPFPISKRKPLNRKNPIEHAVYSLIADTIQTKSA